MPRMFRLLPPPRIAAARRIALACSLVLSTGTLSLVPRSVLAQDATPPATPPVAPADAPPATPPAPPSAPPPAAAPATPPVAPFGDTNSAPAAPPAADSGSAPAAPAQPAAPAPDTTAAPAAPAAPDTTAAPAAPQVAPDLKTLADNFWHYGKIARYDLAVSTGNQILAGNSSPIDVLSAFELAATNRGDNLDQWLLRWQNVPAMKDVTGKLVAVINQGYAARASDPTAIIANIERLSNGERAYLNGLQRLRDSGELAVPFMIDYLRDSSKTQFHPAIRRALVDMGRLALNPLVAATEMKDADTLTTIVSVLGDLGYRDAVPYLARLVASPDAAGPVKSAASDAISRISAASPDSSGYANSSAGDLFFALGNRFYYDEAAIKADPRRQVSYIWYWSGDKGLTKIDVPNPIFSDLMAMRSAEYAMTLGTSQEAQSLWLVANYKREVDLPAGEKDDTRAENQPSAHFYGVDSGTRYLNTALARTLHDHNAAVSLKIIKSLQQIAGEPSALPNGSGPLVDALNYPDRLVRFESAFALAGAMPTLPFKGQERVVPLLAEAMAQTGQISVILLLPKQDDLNSMTEALKGAGFAVTGGTTADAAIAASTGVPAVDVVLTSEDVPAGEVDKLFLLLGGSPRLSGAAKLVMVKTEASPYEQRTVNDPLLSVTEATNAAGLKSAISDAVKKAGALPSDPAVATAYATRAGALLEKLAISNSPVLQIAPAKTTLLAALVDSRNDIVKLAGNVLALLNDKDAQVGLLSAAGDDKAPDDVKISLYKSLATNAKLFGDQLDSSQLDPLEKAVASATNNDVRSAAAEAHGALNLPADQAAKLILDQFKH
jgi:hypothetical protein